MNKKKLFILITIVLSMLLIVGCSDLKDTEMPDQVETETPLNETALVGEEEVQEEIVDVEKMLEGHLNEMEVIQIIPAVSKDNGKIKLAVIMGNLLSDGIQTGNGLYGEVRLLAFGWDDEILFEQTKISEDPIYSKISLADFNNDGFNDLYFEIVTLLPTWSYVNDSIFDFVSDEVNDIRQNELNDVTYDILSKRKLRFFSNNIKKSITAEVEEDSFYEDNYNTTNPKFSRTDIEINSKGEGILKEYSYLPSIGELITVYGNVNGYIDVVDFYIETEIQAKIIKELNGQDVDIETEAIKNDLKKNAIDLLTGEWLLVESDYNLENYVLRIDKNKVLMAIIDSEILDEYPVKVLDYDDATQTVYLGTERGTDTYKVDGNKLTLTYHHGGIFIWKRIK